MANEVRKLKRAAERIDRVSGKERRKSLQQPLTQNSAESLAPIGNDQLKSVITRLGLIVLGVWVISALTAGFTTSRLWQIIPLSIAALVTLLAAGVIVWVRRQTSKARGVASILSGVETAEDRKAALEKLETTLKKKDPAAVFAKAQLEMQEDPDKALATLEGIDLNKVMAPVADEARAQRAMLHLLKGQVSLARQLVDAIELKRHQDAKSRAMMASVVAEAWARSGQPKKGLETLELFNPEEPDFEQVRPQLYRAYAYAYAHTSNTKGMRRILRKMLEVDARLLGAFMAKKTHPLLQKEARQILERSGAVPRKMVVQRR